MAKDARSFIESILKEKFRGQSLEATTLRRAFQTVSFDRPTIENIRNLSDSSIRDLERAYRIDLETQRRLSKENFLRKVEEHNRMVEVDSAKAAEKREKQERAARARQARRSNAATVAAERRARLRNQANRKTQQRSANEKRTPTKAKAPARKPKPRTSKPRGFKSVPLSQFSVKRSTMGIPASAPAPKRPPKSKSRSVKLPGSAPPPIPPSRIRHTITSEEGRFIAAEGKGGRQALARMTGASRGKPTRVSPLLTKSIDFDLAINERNVLTQHTKRVGKFSVSHVTKMHVGRGRNIKPQALRIMDSAVALAGGMSPIVVEITRLGTHVIEDRDGLRNLARMMVLYAELATKVSAERGAAFLQIIFETNRGGKWKENTPTTKARKGHGKPQRGDKGQPENNWLYNNVIVDRINQNPALNSEWGFGFDETKLHLRPPLRRETERFSESSKHVFVEGAISAEKKKSLERSIAGRQGNLLSMAQLALIQELKGWPNLTAVHEDYRFELAAGFDHSITMGVMAHDVRRTTFKISAPSGKLKQAIEKAKEAEI